MGTSTGIALPRTGIGNLRVWVPTYIVQLRKPSEKRDCTNSFVLHVVNARLRGSKTT